MYNNDETEATNVQGLLVYFSVDLLGCFGVFFFTKDYN